MFRFGDPGTRMYGTMGTNNANMLALWNGGSMEEDKFSVGSSQGPSGNNCILFSPDPATNNPSIIAKTLDAQKKWGFACRLKLDFSTISATGWAWLAFYIANKPQIVLRFRPDGAMEIVRGGIQIIGTTLDSLTSNVWNHFEFLFTIGVSDGTVDVWFNSVNVLSITGTGTQDVAPASAESIYFGSITPQAMSFVTGSTPLIYFDDIILYDGQPTDPAGNPDIHSHIGNCRLEWLLPTADGATTQFTSSSGSNFSAVNDPVPDGDASYVYDQSVGTMDTYRIAPIILPGTLVSSVAVVHYARKSDVGPRSIVAEIRTGGSDFDHPSRIDLKDDYSYEFSNWGSDPTDGSIWTPTKVSAVEIGQKVNS
jgi:hypothetical protein